MEFIFVKDSKKIAQVAVILSSMAVLISAVNMLIAGFDGASIPLFCSMLAIYGSVRKKGER